jgi:macrolide transport system ATP-binding/permease protein
MELFKRLNHLGVTLVIVTHDEAVARHARRIIRLLDGRLISDLPNPSAAIDPCATPDRREDG